MKWLGNTVSCNQEVDLLCLEPSIKDGEGAWQLSKREKRRGYDEWVQCYLLVKVLVRNINKGNAGKKIFLILLKKILSIKKYMRCECLKIKMVKKELDVPEYS